jgi:anti-sigma regulatory factor (Ser/Thr protein kinase)/ActR/RegA family two-component response regulator
MGGEQFLRSLVEVLAPSAMKRILMIGDEPGLKTQLAQTPRLRECEIVSASGNAEALQRLRLRVFDQVITDPRTSVEEDLALLAEMRRIRPGLRTFILAPAATPEDIIAALRQEVFAIFGAPFNHAEIADMVVEGLEASEWRHSIEVLSAQRDWISMRVACHQLTADRLVRFMGEMRRDIPEGERDELLIAFREMLFNAMEHGAGFNPEKVIEVTAVRTERAIVYHFRDPGPGFERDMLEQVAAINPSNNPLTHIPYRESLGMRPGGFGILIASQLVDELIYNETGNEVLLVKHTG